MQGIIRLHKGVVLDIMGEPLLRGSGMAPRLYRNFFSDLLPEAFGPVATRVVRDDVFDCIGVDVPGAVALVVYI
jgi:hypothetical protein